MSVVIEEQLFARMVGQCKTLSGETETFLFEVSPEVVEQWVDTGWSEIVRFRLRRTASGFLEMEVMRV